MECPICTEPVVATDILVFETIEDLLLYLEFLELLGVEGLYV